MSGVLVPAISSEHLYPAEAVYMARTTLFETRMLGYSALNLDTVTAHLVGLLNGRVAIRHAAGVDDMSLDLYRRAGIQIEEETLAYRTVEEANQLADSMIEQGKKLFSPYPLPVGRFPDEGQLVSPGLYLSLNAKTNLEQIAPSTSLPRRWKLNCDDLDKFEPGEPVFLKAGGGAATGWGFAVHACQDRAAYNKARQWFADHRDSVPEVLVEEWVEVKTCWCVGIVVGAEQTVCLGGAEQIFFSPARQSGSLIDPENLLPEEGRSLAVAIGDAARKLGYRGIAGLDIGLGRDGKLTVFDPNFRFNASSAQLLFHDSAVKRTSLPVSASLQAVPGGTFVDLTKRLEAPIAEGWFVPTRLFNGEKHPLSLGRHAVNGFVLGSSRLAAEKAAKSLQSELED